MKKLTITQRLQLQVEAGAAFLNVAFPGWETRIDVSNLRLADGNVCVLGQLYDDYGDGKKLLGITEKVAINGNGLINLTEALGFFNDNKSWYPILTRLWKKKIAQLRRKRNR